LLAVIPLNGLNYSGEFCYIPQNSLSWLCAGIFRRVKWVYDVALEVGIERTEELF